MARAIPPQSDPPETACLFALSPPVPSSKVVNAVLLDGVSLPAAEYALFGTLKQRALKSGHEVKKSELLRAGLASLAALPDSALLKALQGIDRLKPGRPVK